MYKLVFMSMVGVGAEGVEGLTWWVPVEWGNDDIGVDVVEVVRCDVVQVVRHVVDWVDVVVDVECVVVEVVDESEELVSLVNPWDFLVG